MHTVVETDAYKIAAAKVGMTDAERDAVLDLLMADPEAGDIIPGAGGARKVRIARDGMGKRGGYRVITYFMDMDTPVFLLTVISKSKSSNLTDAQKKVVKDDAKSVRDA